MTLVPTTAGPIEASGLGRTLGHEHLIGTSEGMRKQWPHLFDEQADVADSIAEVRRAQQHGVQTICDPCVLDIGRDVHVNIAVTKATGVRFVMATGAYGIGFTFSSTMPPQRGVLLDCFIHDIEVGIQGSDVKAGFIKVAGDTPGLTADVEFMHRTAAKAAVATGTPIMAHSNPKARTGLWQMELFLEEGVPAEQVQIAHTGDTDDLDYIEELLNTGCYIGMDRYGIDRDMVTPLRNNTVVALCERGYGDRMTLGQDSAVRIDGRPKAEKLAVSPNSHITYIFEDVIPELRERGVPAETLDAMVGANVHAWLSA